jgi:hypothetical protein
MNAPTAAKDRRVTHLSNFAGFAETACGKSLHGWQGARTPKASSDLRAVTCKACRKAVA